MKFRKGSKEAYHFNLQPVMSLNTTLVLLGILCIFGGLPNVKGSYEGEGLAAHNKYRKIHAAKPMTLDGSMTRQAKAYAQRLARMGSLQHSSSSERPGQGENLAMGCGYKGGLSVQKAVEMWYKEVCKYNFNNPGYSSRTGHFTQVVWKRSTALGIGRATKGSCTYVVARYRPGGNGADFRNNVVKGDFNEGVCRGGRE